MKTMRALLIPLLIALAACASGRTADCTVQSSAQCPRQAAPRRTPARNAERIAIPPPASSAPVVVPQHDVAPKPPPTVGTCDAGGCWDTGGNRYNGAHGTFLNDSGRQCQRNGVSIQCF